MRSLALAVAGITERTADIEWSRVDKNVYNRLLRSRYELKEALSNSNPFDRLMRQSGFGSRLHDELVLSAAEVANVEAKDVPYRITELYRSHLSDLSKLPA